MRSANQRLSMESMFSISLTHRNTLVRRSIVRGITRWRAIALAVATSSLAIAAAAGATAATAATARSGSGPARAAIAGTRPAWATVKNAVHGATARAVADRGTVTASVY